MLSTSFHSVWATAALLGLLASQAGAIGMGGSSVCAIQSTRLMKCELYRLETPYLGPF